MKNPNLPAGLQDMNVEIYVREDQLMASYNGGQIPYIELPYEIKTAFEHELVRDKKALFSLQNDFKLTDEIEIIEQFIKCRFGGFDHKPDLEAGTLKTNYEYWDCGHRGKCSAEGKVCKLPFGPFGTLTPRHVQVVRLLSKGKSDQEIAIEMGVELTTVITYQKRIREKLGVQSRIGIMNFAMKNGLAD